MTLILFKCGCYFNILVVLFVLTRITYYITSSQLRAWRTIEVYLINENIKRVLAYMSIFDHSNAQVQPFTGPKFLRFFLSLYTAWANSKGSVKIAHLHRPAWIVGIYTYVKHPLCMSQLKLLCIMLRCLW